MIRIKQRFNYTFMQFSSSYHTYISPSSSLFRLHIFLQFAISCLCAFIPPKSINNSNNSAESHLSRLQPWLGLVASAALKLNRLLLLGIKLAQNVNLKFKSEKCINSMPRLLGLCKTLVSREGGWGGGGCKSRREHRQMHILHQQHYQQQL